MITAAPKMIAPVGIEMKSSVMILNISLNHPFGSARVGKVVLRTFDTIDPTPIETIIVPKVAIKGGSLSLATMYPFNVPNAVATARISTNESGIDQFQVLYAVPPISVAHIITVPTERSIPPVMITNVTPIARKPM